MRKIITTMIPLLFSLNTFAHGISEEAKRSMIEGGYLKYIWLGAEHMITGYDHLLFLLGVIFFLTTFKDIVKFITAFTLGHSITLILATFMGITANYWLIDAVIAISVCYKGFDNNKGFENYFGLKKAPNLLMMVFIFGLIHGFGLSTRLQQLPLGEKGTEMLMRIISFNVGVEIGQIIALAIMLIILSGFRNTDFFKRFSKITNDGLILAGFMLLLMQLHGYQHDVNSDEFGFAKDKHYHHHMEIMEQQRRRSRGHGHGHGHGHDHGDGHGHDHGDGHDHDNL
jgi:hypothetical protein